MPLSNEERATLKRLQQKEKEPDAGPVGRSVRVNIDLGDESQIARAIKYGFLTSDEVEEDKNGAGGDDDEEADDSPNRRGYFR